MERGSDKHGAQLDEQMAHETSGYVQGAHSPRVEEWHEPEPAGEDEPDATQIPEDESVGGTPPGMDAADVAGRSELSRYVSPARFPADRDALLASAGDNQAPDAVLAQLRSLPADRDYANITAVWAALGHGTEDDPHRF